MVAKRQKAVPFEEAKRAVESVSRRVALLHLSYAKTIMKELGEDKGRKIIAKAIKDFGMRMGQETRKEVLDQGLEALPKNFNAGNSYALPNFGIHEKIENIKVEGEPRARFYGCKFAKVWKEYGEEKLGRLYCYMDVAKYMGYNPDYKFVHTKTTPDGDDYCELAVRPTTRKERKDFSTENRDWLYIDK